MNVSRYLAAGVLLVVLIGGCCGGGRSNVSSTTKTTTVGQELMDLRKAYESGAINEEQYNKMKQDIINKSEQN